MGTSITLPQEYEKRQKQSRYKKKFGKYSQNKQRHTTNALSLDDILHQKMQQPPKPGLNKIKFVSIQPLNIQQTHKKDTQKQKIDINDKTQVINSIHSIQQQKPQQHFTDVDIKITINCLYDKQIKIDIPQNTDGSKTGPNSQMESKQPFVDVSNYGKWNAKPVVVSQSEKQSEKQEYSIWKSLTSQTKEHFKNVIVKTKSANKGQKNGDMERLRKAQKQNNNNMMDFNQQDKNQETEQGFHDDKKRFDLATLSLKSKFSNQFKIGNDNRPKQLMKKRLNLAGPEVYQPLLYRRKLKEVIYYDQQTKHNSVILPNKSQK